jgi:CDP-diacylglycerol--serine O-phosphatidyltransferase
MNELDTDNEASEVVKRRRGIYLLPNLFTTAALFAGFYAVVAAMNNEFWVAGVAIFVAMILDGMDGRVARLTNTQSEFGVQYDSLSDMVSFGVAPSLVVFEWALAGMQNMGDTWGKLGWIGAFTYTACAALRLARFNTQVGVVDKRYFQGLPSPAAAAVVASLVWVGDDLGARGLPIEIVAWLLTVSVALLMVSNIRYYSFKEFDFRYRVPFVAMVVLAVAFAVAQVHLPMTLFLIFLVYMLSGPVLTVLQRRRRRLQRIDGETP